MNGYYNDYNNSSNNALSNLSLMGHFTAMPMNTDTTQQYTIVQFNSMNGYYNDLNNAMSIWTLKSCYHCNYKAAQPFRILQERKIFRWKLQYLPMEHINTP